MSKFERDYARERLTHHELSLVDSLPHKLSDELFTERRKIMKREVMRDMFWGFYDDDRNSRIKRFIYTKFIHRFLKKRDLPPIFVPPEDDEEDILIGPPGKRKR